MAVVGLGRPLTRKRGDGGGRMAYGGGITTVGANKHKRCG